MGLFLVGGLTGLFLASLGLDVHLHDTYFVVAHFHYIMVGGAIMGFFAGLHYTGRRSPAGCTTTRSARRRRCSIFVGFNLTFFPQFILGYLGMPRRYHAYPPEFQVFNVLSSAGATVLAIGYLLPVLYFTYSIFKGQAAGNNPWGATGLEWTTQSPPLPENFPDQPVVTEEAYDYSKREIKVA
jgi:cytochrome c oxidase subunit 1